MQSFWRALGYSENQEKTQRTEEKQPIYPQDNLENLGSCPFLRMQGHAEKNGPPDDLLLAASHVYHHNTHRKNNEYETNLSQQAAEEKYYLEAEKLKEKFKDYSALLKHIAYFSAQDGSIDSASVIKKFRDMNESVLPATIKGFFISQFNINFVGKYKESEKYIPTEDNIKRLHHVGTAGVYDYKTGNINEDRWQAFVAGSSIEKDKKQIFPQSKLLIYMQSCYQNDPRTKNPDYGPIRARFEAEGGKQAWEENYRKLAEGWIENEKGDLEPYMTIEGMRLFFEDSPLAYLKVECGLLPIKKPDACVIKPAIDSISLALKPQ